MTRIAGVMLAVTALAARAETVVTDEAWKGCDVALQEWEAPEHDDGDWDAADTVDGPESNGRHYTVENLFGIASGARWIWAGGARECWLRRRMTAPLWFRRAEMLFIADDIVEVYVNGALADSYDTNTGGWGMRGTAVVLDLAPWFEPGDNVIAVHVANRSGPRGFAAEIRVNGDPFVAVAEPAKPLPEDVLDDVRRLAPKLDDDDAEVRDKASGMLERLARLHGEGVATALETALPSPSPEARGRMLRVRAATEVNLEPTVAGDPRFGFGRLTAGQLEKHLTADGESQRCGIRTAVWMQSLLRTEPAAALALLDRLLRQGDEAAAERAARVVAMLGVERAADAVAASLAARPKTRAGAFAAAALARVGREKDREALEAAARCGHAETERAAKRALGNLGK